MAWTKYAHPDALKRTRRITLNQNYGGSLTAGAAGYDNVNTLTHVFKGRTDRIARYSIYDQMDQDSDVARALDIIAETIAPNDNLTELPFYVRWIIDEITEEETSVLQDNLKFWTKKNEWDVRVEENVRNVIKYGDWFYWRNPNTFELYDLHPKLVIGAIVDQTKLEVLAWIVKGLKFNVEDMEIVDQTGPYGGAMSALNYSSPNGNVFASGITADAKVIPAKHIIHISLNEGRFSSLGSTDDDQAAVSRWPFGESFLDNIYHTYIQRRLMEEAALIHAMQRAPARRVWYIDVGKARPDKAKWIIQDMRNEIAGKYIPQVLGTDTRTLDTVYNTQSSLEDYWIPVNSDSRGSKVEMLDGQEWTENSLLKYLTDKMWRALRIPSSYMSQGQTEGGALFNDAKVGMAYMEEIEFTKFCMRIQNLLDNEYDHEFKMFCKWSGMEFNSADFELKFIKPTDYKDYLQNQRDQDAINVWANVKDDPSFSKRFAMKRWLKLTEEEILENERMVMEERYPLDEQPQSDGLGGLGAPPMGGGMLPPPGDLSGGMGMDGLPGADTGAVPGPSNIGMGAAPLGGNMAAAGGMAGGMGGFGESKQMRGPVINEEFTTDDLAPPSPKMDLPRTGVYKDRPAKDRGFMANDPISSEKPVITLGMIKKLRHAHVTRRIEQQKRLRVIRKVYAVPSPDAGLAGGPPMPPI